MTGTQRTFATILVLLGLLICVVVGASLWPRPVLGVFTGLSAAIRDRFAAGAADTAAGGTTREGAPARLFRPSPAQRATLNIAPIATVSFRSEGTAEGRIALNDDDNVTVT